MTNVTFFNGILDLFEYLIHQMFINPIMKQFLYFAVLMFVVYCFRKVIHV